MGHLPNNTIHMMQKTLILLAFALVATSIALPSADSDQEIPEENFQQISELAQDQPALADTKPDGATTLLGGRRRRRCRVLRRRFRAEKRKLEAALRKVQEQLRHAKHVVRAHIRRVAGLHTSQLRRRLKRAKADLRHKLR